ncbi:hypothetical protein SAMN02990966_05155 [Rhodospirillales bacterium URHD0017]|nr:hypothetical protein SAMN02990966_05155 [Rhodospirillales bacterium URHD0017]
MATDPRRRMVRRQIVGRGIGDRVREFAYENTPLPIEEGETYPLEL